MSQNRSSGDVGVAGNVGGDDGRLTSVEWLKDWVEGGPEWVKLLKLSGSLGYSGRSKNSAIKWYLAAQKTFESDTNGVADVTFVRHGYKGGLKTVKIKFHSLGLARVHFVEDLDCVWSVGLCIAMPRYICIPLDWVFEDYRLASGAQRGCVCKSRDFLTCQRFPRLREEFACKTSEGSVSEQGHVEVLVPSIVLVVNPVEAAAATPVAVACPTVVRGNISTAPTSVAASALYRMRTSCDDSSSFSSNSDSSVMDVWEPES